jgi:ubiquinone/menaquinone biosynthesis C-methylase UbiE
MTRIGGENGLHRAPQAYAYSRSARRRWDHRNPGNAAARRELADALLEVARDTLAARLPILDVGCGTGWWLETLGSTGAAGSDLHGIELDPRRAEAARRRVPTAGIAVGDATALPYPDGRFGLVTLIVLLSSLPSTRAIVGALCEARRVLAPGGTIAVYEPRIPNPLNRAVRLVRACDFDRAGLVPRVEGTLTLVPQVGRRLGPLTPTLHAALSRVPLLRSHRLTVYRAGAPMSPGHGR